MQMQVTNIMFLDYRSNVITLGIVEAAMTDDDDFHGGDISYCFRVGQQPSQKFQFHCDRFMTCRQSYTGKPSYHGYDGLQIIMSCATIKSKLAIHCELFRNRGNRILM